ncbi:hypothetical protein [Cryobacterium melibiosiphilum]|nr:hypothetical protein [Cryobacterium melibiosiphilum]
MATVRADATSLDRKRRRSQRAAPVALLALVSALLLGGCALLPPGGESGEATHERLDSLAGVADSRVRVANILSGFTRYWSTTVEITVADDYAVGDADAALDWLLHTAWSINNQEPNSGVLVGFVNPDGTTADWDWHGALTAAGYDADWIGRGMDEGGILLFKSENVTGVLGDWPAAVPDLPAGVLVAD